MTAGCAWYHVLFFALGGTLGAVALFSSAVALATPESRGLMALTVGCASLSAIALAATAVHRAVHSVRRGQAVLAYAVLQLATDQPQGEVPQPEWFAELRQDLAVIGNPGMIDLEPLQHLQRLARRLQPR